MSAVGRFRVGDVVIVERDETRWPSRGSWPRYRGRVGTVRTVARSVGEIGVTFERTPTQSSAVSWFRPYELTRTGEQKQVSPSGVKAPDGAAEAEDGR